MKTIILVFGAISIISALIALHRAVRRPRPGFYYGWNGWTWNIKSSFVAISVALFSFGASAQDAKTPLTIQQCLEVLAGLNSLNFIGQMNPQQTAPADAKSYKLSGPLRMTIALNIGDLSRVQSAAAKAQQDFEKTLTPPPTGNVAKMTPEEQQAGADRVKKLGDNWKTIIDGPCPVRPGMLKESDLNLGDLPDKNPVPPSVLSTLVPIIER